MIQKEQYKELREKLEENLEVLQVPRSIWHCSQLLIATLWILSIAHWKYTNRAFKTWKLAREIYIDGGNTTRKEASIQRLS